MGITMTEQMQDTTWANGEQVTFADEGIAVSIATTWGEEVEEEQFTKVVFEHDLRKVSRKRNIPIGENIRDAIRSIKGK